MSMTMSEISRDLELIRLQYRQGNFKRSLSDALLILKNPEILKDTTSYLQTVRLAYQSSLELRQLDQVLPYIETLKTIENPWADYILGLWSLDSLPVEQADEAQRYFEKALSNSVGEVNHELTCRLLHALATVRIWKKEISEAEALIDKVLFLSRELKLDEIEASALILQSMILSNHHKTEHALEALWKSYEIAKRGFYIHLQANILIFIANTYSVTGNTKMVQIYANIALRGLDEERFPRLYQAAGALLASSDRSIKEPDLRIDVDRLNARVRGKGFVEFGNQHVLFDLLMLLAMHPGKRFTKEQLIGRVWKQMYDSSIHDNLIYVSVKRLRKILEPNDEAPLFVLRDRQGYYLSSQIIVEMSEGMVVP